MKVGPLIAEAESLGVQFTLEYDAPVALTDGTDSIAIRLDYPSFAVQDDCEELIELLRAHRSDTKQFLLSRATCWPPPTLALIDSGLATDKKQSPIAPSRRANSAALNESLQREVEALFRSQIETSAECLF